MKISRVRLEMLQRRAGLTGETLAARAGITPPMLSRLKSRGSCSPTTGRKLATVLGSYDFVVHDRPRVTPFALPTLEECWAERERAGLSNTGVPTVNPYEMAREERETENTLQIIREFLDRPVPVDWAHWTLPLRLRFWAGGGKGSHLVQRDRVCAAEVWAEAFRHPSENMTNKNARSINRIISTLPGWRKADKALRFGPHGVCWGFVRNL